MFNYGKITKAQASKIGDFIDNDGIMFTPYCMEMTDGTYLISKESWEKYKGFPQFSGLVEPTWYEYSDLIFKKKESLFK